jgi:hypothetical protein
LYCVSLAKHNDSDQRRENEIDKARNVHWEANNVCKFFNGRPEGKRPLTHPRHTLQDKIKTNLKGREY